jgi:two-component system, OmpR family, sensor histidine kinase MtrB
MLGLLQSQIQLNTPSYHGSIKRFILLWVGTIITACVVLSGALLVITGHFHSVNEKGFTEFQAMNMAHSVEMAVVREDRDYLRWRISKKDLDKATITNDLLQARKYIDELDVAGTTLEEELLIDKIEDAFQDLSYKANQDSVISEEKQLSLTSSVLASLENYRRFNETRVSRTMEMVQGFHTIINRWLILLMLSVAIIITIGSVMLIRRIVRPAEELSKAALRYGQGDFSARAVIRYHDELGNLGQTFNNMAEDIARRETSRLGFIAALFHDIKNPLVNIGASVNLLRKKRFPQEQLDEWLKRIAQEVHRLEDISQDLTDTVQVESGQLVLQTEEMDMGELVNEICKEQAEVLTHHTVECEGCSQCRIMGDKKRLERVIINLLSNSIKYSPEGTTITIRLERIDSQVRLSVIDRGVGIAPEEIPILFQPFGRLSRTKNMARGTGLGLSIVKKIIEAHGGTIQVKSAVDAGTTMEVTLPGV